MEARLLKRSRDLLCAHASGFGREFGRLLIRSSIPLSSDEPGLLVSVQRYDNSISAESRAGPDGQAPKLGVPRIVVPVSSPTRLNSQEVSVEPYVKIEYPT